MPESDWMLEENSDEGMLEELRQQKAQRLKEDIECPHCKAELPRDRAFRNLHMNQCRRKKS